MYTPIFWMLLQSSVRDLKKQSSYLSTLRGSYPISAFLNPLPPEPHH